ncbi:uncharacterized protein [Ptychodera flava]|uniref:uncharacterized protein n=1 Tax=Ptychodera flava TaxID=63121 RepID=UPI003969C03C
MKDFLCVILICCWQLQHTRVTCRQNYVDYVPECSGTWTSFYDRDNPSGTGDWESLNSLQSENPGEICDNPTAVYAETVTGVPAELTGEVFQSYDTVNGFICVSADQTDKTCHDYRVNFCCRDCDGMITKLYDRDDPTGAGDWEDINSLTSENPGKICASPSAIYAETMDGVAAESTGEVFEHYNPTQGFICKKDSQSDGECMDYRVKFCCPADTCSEWTNWYDRDNPSGNGDFELLRYLHNEYPLQICRRPSGMQVRDKQSGEIVSPDDGNFQHFDTTIGFACSDRNCEDYEVRFCCSREVF